MEDPMDYGYGGAYEDVGGFFDPFEFSDGESYPVFSDAQQNSYGFTDVMPANEQPFEPINTASDLKAWELRNDQYIGWTEESPVSDYGVTPYSFGSGGDGGYQGPQSTPLYGGKGTTAGEVLQSGTSVLQSIAGLFSAVKGATSQGGSQQSRIPAAGGSGSSSTRASNEAVNRATYGGQLAGARPVPVSTFPDGSKGMLGMLAVALVVGVAGFYVASR